MAGPAARAAAANEDLLAAQGETMLGVGQMLVAVRKQVVIRPMGRVSELL